MAVSFRWRNSDATFGWLSSNEGDNLPYEPEHRDEKADIYRFDRGATLSDYLLKEISLLHTAEIINNGAITNEIW